MTTLSASRWNRALVGVRPVDVAIGGGLFALGLADALTTDEYAGGTARLVVAASLQTLPLIWRRARTLAAVSLSLLGLAVEVAGQEPYGGVYGLLGLLVLVHAVARWTTGATRWQGLGLLGAGVVVHTLSEGVDGPLGAVGPVVVTLVVGGAAWSIGLVGRRADVRARELERSREVAVAEERARISRELHDVVGHALAGISLTAGAAEHTRDPAEVSSSLHVIRTLSRDAAADVRRLIGLLREDEGDAVRPQPTLADVPRLVDGMRQAGMDVVLREEGESSSVPPGLQLAAFRVVQEGLTNAARHAPDAAVVVTVDAHPATLAVEVGNAPSAVSVAAGAAGAGFGLVGMHERVLLYDGTLEAATTDDGGYVLRAEFPRP